MGLVKLGRVALDGTKLRANASKHKAMSYERLVDKEGAGSALCGAAIVVIFSIEFLGRYSWRSGGGRLTSRRHAGHQ
jgi:hypothetical protein